MAREKQALWISGPTYEYGDHDRGYYDDHRNHVLTGSFQLDALPTRLTLTIAVLGYAYVTVNGKALELELLGEWTNYQDHVYQRRLDITALVRIGSNELSIELGNGWYNPSPLRLFGKYNLRERLSEVGTPKVLATVSDDQDLLLVTDEHWTCEEGSLLFNNLYLGERWDLRGQGRTALPLVAEPNTRRLLGAPTPPCQREKPLDPVVIHNEGEHLILDFGVTITGFLDLIIQAREGARVTVTYAENLDDQGELDVTSNAAGAVGLSPAGYSIIDGGPGAPELANQSDSLICRTGKNHICNRFTYHSFRYARIEGLHEKDLLSARAIPVHTDLKQTGSLHVHQEAYETLLQAALRTKLNNVHGTWEDCARERLGYGGDMVALAESNLMSYDCSGLIVKTLSDMRADQTAAGGIPETAPFMGIGSNGTAPGEGPLLWQLAYPYLLVTALRWYGDLGLIEEHWPQVRAFADYLLSWDPSELSAHCLGDHGSIATPEGGFHDGTPDKPLVGWCAILWVLKCAIRLARVLGHDADAQRYQTAFDEVRHEATERFTNADDTLGNDTQTGYAFGAYFALGYPEELVKRLASKLEGRSYILDTGIFGSKLAFEMLHSSGRDEVIERWLLREDHPSLLAAARVNGVLPEELVGMCSHNHAMFSSYVAWMYHALAGMTVADDAVGCDHMIFNPYFSPTTDHVEASLATVKGKVSTSWVRSGGTVTYTVTLPQGITPTFAPALGLATHDVDAMTWTFTLSA